MPNDHSAATRDWGPAALTPAKQTALDWVKAQADWLSKRHTEVWNFHEPAWREYRSAAWYVKLLREQGFEVEEGTATMPTAFRATFGKGKPVIATYAEYDAVPGQQPGSRALMRSRATASTNTPPATPIPHSALGLGALGGLLAAKAAMEKHSLPGTLVFFGEPAEKVCGSKPVHAAHGYYDDLDATIAFHPAFSTAHANTVIWDTHCGSYWSRMYSFECPHPEEWSGMGAGEGASAHTMARAPGAIDAVCLMYMTSKMTKEAMLPHTGTWTINEAILAAGQATADNLAPNFSQIQYSSRCPTLEMQERIYADPRQQRRQCRAGSPIARCARNG